MWRNSLTLPFFRGSQTPPAFEMLHKNHRSREIKRKQTLRQEVPARDPSPREETGIWEPLPARSPTVKPPSHAACLSLPFPARTAPVTCQRPKRGFCRPGREEGVLLSYKFPVERRSLWKSFPGSKAELAATWASPWCRGWLRGVSPVPRAGTWRNHPEGGKGAAGGILQFAR